MTTEYEAFRNDVLEQLRIMRASLTCEGAVPQLDPMAVFVDDNGERHLIMLPEAAPRPGSLIRIIRHFTGLFAAVRVMILHEAWRRLVSRDQLSDGVLPSQAANRQEVIAVYALDKATDRMMYVTQEIDRDATGKPVFRKEPQVDENQLAFVGGRMPGVRDLWDEDVTLHSKRLN